MTGYRDMARRVRPTQRPATFVPEWEARLGALWEAAEQHRIEQEV